MKMDSRKSYLFPILITYSITATLPTERRHKKYKFHTNGQRHKQYSIFIIDGR